MKKLLYSSPYVPAEWVTAHGFQPIRFVANESGWPDWKIDEAAHCTEGLCPYASAFLSEAETGDFDVVVATTTCDQMRHIPEIAETDCSIFLMSVPSTWQSPGSFRLYIRELERLGAFLSAESGVAPDATALAEVLQAAEARRDQTGSQTTIPPGRVPIAITGGPLLPSANGLVSEIERAGGVVVLDATESGKMSMPARFDRRRLQDEPFQVMAEAYFAIPDIGRRPNSQYYSFIERELSAHDVSGLIIQRHTWCDLWHAEVQRLKEWAPIPVLDLDGGHSADARSKTRIQAFMEMLRG